MYIRSSSKRKKVFLPDIFIAGDIVIPLQKISLTNGIHYEPNVPVRVTEYNKIFFNRNQHLFKKVEEDNIEVKNIKTQEEKAFFDTTPANYSPLQEALKSLRRT